MSTRRKDIRNAVVDILKRAKVVNAENIIANRSMVYESENLPAVSVYTVAEEVVSELSQAPREIRRELSLVIEVVTAGLKGDADTADRLDDLCEIIERKITADDSLGKTADDCELDRVDFDYEDENVESPLHTARLVWKVTYTTFMPRDRFDQAQVDFQGLDANWTVGHHNLGDTDLTPQPEADQAKDTVDVPTS